MDLDKVKTLINFVGQSRISELVVTESGTTVRISRGEQAPAAGGASGIDEGEQLDAAVPETRTAGKLLTVCAPVFGLLHRAPNPGAPPFVEVGDTVDAGQSLFVIEAMKVFNMVSAEQAGRVVRILGVDGQEVEAGQPLMEIA